MKITIGARLGFGFLVMLLLVATAGLTAVISFDRLADLTAALAEEGDELRTITDIRVVVAEAHAALERAMVTGEEEDVAAAELRQSELQEMVTAYLDSKEAAGVENEAFDELELAQQLLDDTLESYLHASDLSANLRLTAFSRRQELVDFCLTILTEIESEAKDRMADALEEIQSAQSSLLLMMSGVTVVAAVIGAGLAVGITRSVTVPVGKLVSAADKISTGDLDALMEVRSQDEIGELADSMERMRVSMKAAIERLKKRR
jgi:HAMP domain-containing protein